MARDGWAVSKLDRAGRPLPQWAQDEPQLPELGQFYFRAFDDLSTEREIGQVMGPIPWSSIVKYAELRGLDVESSAMFEKIMRNMDEEFISWTVAQEKKARDKTAPKST